MIPKTCAALAVLLALLLASCGVPASASPAPPPPTFPPPPPLDPATAARTPEPTPPPAPTAAAAPQGSTLFADSFDAADLKGWTPTSFFDRSIGASWRVGKGELRQAGDDSGSPGRDAAYLVAGDASWRDYSIETAAYATSETELGLVARYSDKGFYRARLVVGEQQSSVFLTAISADGSYRELGKSTLGGTLGRWLRLRLVAQGNTLTLTVDDAEVLSASDSAFANGQAGVFALSDGVARFDNFSVKR